MQIMNTKITATQTPDAMLADSSITCRRAAVENQKSKQLKLRVNVVYIYNIIIDVVLNTHTHVYSVAAIY